MVPVPIIQFHMMDPDPFKYLSNTDPDLGGNFNPDPPGSGSETLVLSLMRKIGAVYWYLVFI